MKSQNLFSIELHFGPGLGLEDKPESGSSFCVLVGEPKPGSSFETCLNHFHRDDSARPVWPCLCPTVADVELCHWPCQSLHTLRHPSQPPMSSYPTKNPPPYVPNLYKQEVDAIQLSSCFDKLLAWVCFFGASTLAILLHSRENPAGLEPLSSRL